MKNAQIKAIITTYIYFIYIYNNTMCASLIFAFVINYNNHADVSLAIVFTEKYVYMYVCMMYSIN